MNSTLSRRLMVIALLAVTSLGTAASCLAAAENGDGVGEKTADEKTIRELFVPYEDLDLLLQQQPQRVLLSRGEYDELVRKAHSSPERNVPHAAVLVSADYTAAIRGQGFGRHRLEVSGKLTVDVMKDGLFAVPLDLAGVGLQAATLDGRNAPIGQADDGQLTLLVEGVGRHELTLTMVAPLETTAAEQRVRFRLPRPPAATLRLTVPGDVEIKSGAEVVSRVVDEAAAVTRFELLLRGGDTTLVMSLNSHLKRTQQAVVARSVLVDEVTGAYEKLHATISLAVLHRAVDRFRFVVPEGFEIAEVNSPLLARWDVKEEPTRNVLTVHLREQTTETVVLTLSAVKAPSELDAWQFPRLIPLDVVGEMAIVGLLAEQRLEAKAIVAEELISIDTSVLQKALPETIYRAAPGTPPLRPIVAYLAPQGSFRLSARFDVPPARLAVRSNVLLILDEKGHQVHGGVTVVPEIERLRLFDITVPPSWHVTSVIGANAAPLVFERYGALEEPSRIRIRLPHAVRPGQEYSINFHAVHSPPGWLGDWAKPFAVTFPRFAVIGAQVNVGAIACEVRDDMIVRPEILSKKFLTPLDEAGKQQYGLGDVATSLAYRYETPDYELALHVERTEPRLTARTYSFFRIEPEGLTAHYEIRYDIDEARTGRLVFDLPETTPDALSIRGLDGLKLKEFGSEEVENGRRWTVLLEDAQRGSIGLAVDFVQPLPMQEPKGLILPIVRAKEVAYQSGMVAVEGSAELTCVLHVGEISGTNIRSVDIGELVDAEYQPGRRLLGAFGFVGEEAEVKVDVARDPAYRLLPSAIVQKAVLNTYLAVEGTSQTQADLTLRTKALYVEVRLPSTPGRCDSELWSAVLDGTPVKPQREGDRLLVSLPAGPATEKPGGATRELKIVYQTSFHPVSFRGDVAMPALKLFLPTGPDGKSVEVPLVNLVWNLHVPSGFEVVRSGGTVVTDQIVKPTPAIVEVAAALYYLSGGATPFYGGIGASRESARMAQTVNRYKDGRSGASPYDLSGGTQTQYETSDAAEGEGTAGWLPQSGFDQAGAMDGDEEDSAEMPGDDMPAEEMPGDDMPTDDPAQPTAEAAAEAPEPQAPMTVDESRPPTEEPPPPPVVIVHSVTAPSDPMQVLAGEMLQPGHATTTRSPTRSPTNQPSTLSSQPKPAPPKKPSRQSGSWSYLGGVPSLDIDLTQDAASRSVREGREIGQEITFRSLGVEPRLHVTLVNRSQHRMLAWGLVLAIALVGLTITNRKAATKARFLIGVALLATLVPLAVESVATARTCNMLFYAASLLVPYYLVAAFVKWLCRSIGRILTLFGIPRLVKGVATTATVACVAVLVSSTQAAPPTPESKSGPYVIQIVEPPAPIDMPADAVILPYDADSETGIADADKLLIPYARYEELWNRAYPNEKIGMPEAPLPYALAGATYETLLAGEEYLLVSGRLVIDVYTDSHVTIPLGLEGGVLAHAELDGRPARLQVALATGAATGAGAKESQELLLLHVSGKGRHTLELAVRLRLSRQGGWRVAEGRLPSAPAGMLAVTVPVQQTEIRLNHVTDRRNYETEQADETIVVALDSSGAIGLRWRPKVAAGRVDRTLTAQSTAVLDVQEDGLRLVWQLQLQFRRNRNDPQHSTPGSQPRTLNFTVPSGYLVEKVEGSNVRGWQVRDAPGGNPTVDVTLLTEAKDREQFTFHLWRRAAVGKESLREFETPAITIADAALHSGRLTIRRSPLLQLRTLERIGVTRTDFGSDATELAGGADAEQSPLGIRPYQAYRFVAMPFSIRLAASPITPKITATVQTILNIAEYQRSLESRVVLDVRDANVHRIELFVPESLKIEHVSAPGEFQWALTEEEGRRLLTLYLASPRQGEVAVLVKGTLGQSGTIDELALPQLEVRGGDFAILVRQQGDIAVQIDPAFDVVARDLQQCEKVLLNRLHDWLTPGQRRATRLALHYRQAGYSGTLHFSPRQPIVTCTTISNVRVTDRVVEETILLDFDIQEAGIRELSFLLPSGMEDCRISVPSLRQKTIEPVGPDEDAANEDRPIRVRLELQDETMGHVSVLVENDRLLKPKEPHAVPIPVVETGRTVRRFVVLQSTGRDEVLIDSLVELRPLSRQQKEWQSLRSVLGDGITRAYLVDPGASQPEFVFRTKLRDSVETAGASIPLAQTDLWLDANGAYRAWVTYHMDNATEQFLTIELPDGATLWTARVAEEPVKPTVVPGANDDRQVRIPLVKTASGDLAYPVVLAYGGKMPALGLGGRVHFPLVRTKNINIERSNVQLNVPKAYRWLKFGGTMHQVAEQADLEAEFFAFQTKQAERVVMAVRGANPYAQVRGLSNLKQLDLASHNWEKGKYAPNANLESQVATNTIALKKAISQLEDLTVAAQQSDSRDNRDSLKESFSGQKNERTRNVVQDLGGNFSTIVDTPDDYKNGGRDYFNHVWLDNNSLQNPAFSPDGKKPAGGKRLSSPSIVLWNGQQASTSGKPSMQAPQIAQGRAKAALVESYARQQVRGEQSGRGDGDRGRDKVMRYQEKLQEQTARINVGGNAVDMAGLDGRPARFEDAAASVGMQTAGAFSADLGVPVTMTDGSVAYITDEIDVNIFRDSTSGGRETGQTTTATAGTTGLASLDLERPTDGDAYLAYHFTVPRGKVELNARVVSKGLLRSLSYLAVLTAAIAVTIGTVRLARSGRFARLKQRGGWKVLVALGLLSLFVGIFPVVGLAALIGGLGLAVRGTLVSAS